MVDIGHCPSNDQNADDTGNTQYHLEIEASLKQENDDRVPKCESDETNRDKDIMDNCENSYQDVSWIKKETGEIRLHSMMPVDLKRFSILIPKKEKESCRFGFEGRYFTHQKAKRLFTSVQGASTNLLKKQN